MLSFSDAARKYSNMIFWIAFNYTKNKSDSEDIVQNVLIKLYKNYHKIKSEDHLKNWLGKVTNNESIRFIKENPPLVIDNDDYANSLFVDNIKEKDIFLDLMNLDPKYSTVLYLYYYEKYSTDDIAKALSKKPSTIRSLLSRGRKILKEKWGDINE